MVLRLLAILVAVLALGESAERYRHYDLADLEKLQHKRQLPRQIARGLGNVMQPSDRVQVESRHAIGNLMDRNRFKQAGGPPQNSREPVDMIKPSDWDQNKFRQYADLSAEPEEAKKPETEYQKQHAIMMKGQLDKENKDFATKVASHLKSDAAKSKATMADTANKIKISEAAHAEASDARAQAQKNETARAAEEKTNPKNDPLRWAGMQQVAENEAQEEEEEEEAEAEEIDYKVPMTPEKMQVIEMELSTVLSGMMSSVVSNILSQNPTAIRHSKSHVPRTAL